MNLGVSMQYGPNSHHLRARGLDGILSISHTVIKHYTGGYVLVNARLEQRNADRPFTKRHRGAQVSLRLPELTVPEPQDAVWYLHMSQIE